MAYLNNQNAAQALPSSSKPSSPQPSQQSFQPVKPNYDPFVSLSQPSSKPSTPTPKPPSSMLLAMQQQPARTGSPFQYQQSTQPPPPPSSALLELGSSSSTGPAQDDEWTFSSALPPDHGHATTITNTAVRIDIMASRQGPLIKITLRVSNNTAQLISDFTFQAAVTKVWRLCGLELPRLTSFAGLYSAHGPAVRSHFDAAAERRHQAGNDSQRSRTWKGRSSQDAMESIVQSWRRAEARAGRASVLGNRMNGNGCLPACYSEGLTCSFPLRIFPPWGPDNGNCSFPCRPLSISYPSFPLHLSVLVVWQLPDFTISMKRRASAFLERVAHVYIPKQPSALQPVKNISTHSFGLLLSLLRSVAHSFC